MPEIKKFISSVAAYPHICDIKSYKFEKFRRIWDRVANRCHLSDGLEAYNTWSKLLGDYVEFLRNGGDFKYGIELRFMQAHLVDASSDSSDIDEAILLEAINHTDDADSDIEIKPTKKPRPEEIHEVIKEKVVKPAQEKKNPNPTEVHEVRTPKVPAMEPTTNVADLSSLQLIFLGYAKILQDLPLSIQLKTKHKIAQIMNEAELSLIETNDSSGVKK